MTNTLNKSHRDQSAKSASTPLVLNNSLALMGELHTFGTVNVFVFMHHLLHHKQRFNTREPSFFIQGHKETAATSTVRPGVHNSCPPRSCEHTHTPYCQLSAKPRRGCSHPTSHHISPSHPTSQSQYNYTERHNHTTQKHVLDDVTVWR